MLQESNPGELAAQVNALSITPWPLGSFKFLFSSYLSSKHPVREPSQILRRPEKIFKI